MRKILAWLVFVLGTAAVLTLAANAALTDRLIFLSTQLRPIAEAQKMRNLILKDFAREVEFITEPPQGLQVRLKAGSASDATAIDVIGALHGELQPLALLDVLVPLQLLAEGHRNKKIAQMLGISIKTVETHRTTLMRKIGVKSIVELVRYAVRNNLTEA
jgi:ATP/maltotriose-dependent transcriptional regulator MalT